MTLTVDAPPAGALAGTTRPEARPWVDPTAHLRAGDLRPNDVIRLSGDWYEVLDVFRTLPEFVGWCDGSAEEATKGDQEGAPKGWGDCGMKLLCTFPLTQPRDWDREARTNDRQERWIGDRLGTGEFVMVRILEPKRMAGGELEWSFVVWPKYEPIQCLRTLP